MRTHRCAQMGACLATLFEPLGLTADDVAAMTPEEQKELVGQLCPVEVPLHLELSGKRNASTMAVLQVGVAPATVGPTASPSATAAA